MRVEKGRTFGNLLRSVATDFKQDQVDLDEKCAGKSLIDEACEMTQEWIRETADRHMAKRIAEKLHDEELREQSVAECKGESMAMKLAIEERRRVKMEENTRMALSESDFEFARQTVLDEIDAECEMKQSCEKDDEFAKQLHERLQQELLSEEFAGIQ